VLTLPFHAHAQVTGLDAPEPVGAFFNGVFPESAPGSVSGWQTENAFPNLTFVDPLWLTEIPGTSQLLLVGKNGQLWRFENNPAVTQAQVVKVLEWVSNTQSSEDQGFYSLAFHPEFGQAGSPNANYAYVCYNHRPALAGADANHSFWRVSRFTWQPATGTLDPASEFVLMNQYDRCRWHNGGGMFFGSDGFLYINCGDGGDSGEGGGLTGADGALSRTQRLDWGLFSGVFRIDVDNDPARSHPIRRQPQSPTNKPAGWPASFTQGYGIPNDNPWLDPAGTILEEYWSLGLRSPHTMHYDAVTGDIWIGDVGEGAREEMTRAPKGSNAQWGFREGDINGPGATPATLIGTSEPPFLAYNRTTGTCIIGGMRYRGAKWDALLGGKVLYGDHVRGRIWTATPDAGGGAPLIEEIVAGLPTGNKAGIANFCTDSSGEIFLPVVNGTNQPGGTILKLTTAGVAEEPPQFLSQTGVFTHLQTLATAPGVIPYDVANPLWSDAAAKQRWIILPNDGSHDSAAEDIVFSEEGNWRFPAGTVLVKNFEVALDENNPASVKRLETRFLICTADGGKYGVTYRWNSAGTDAELLTGGETESYDVTLAGGGVETRNWDYPSRADCMLCHNETAGQALGVRTHSLNRSLFYEATGRHANQLSTFNALGMFDVTLTAAQLADFIEARALDDETAPLEHRVRSYLDSNCSHCHQPGATVPYFDARLGTPLNVQGLINGIVQGHFSLGPDGRYMKPGDAALSAVHVRLANVGNGAAMPPLAKNVVDQEAVALLQQYLESLQPQDFVLSPASPTARYVRLTAGTTAQDTEVNGNAWTSVGEFAILNGEGMPIPISELSVHAVDSEELENEFSPAAHAIDGDPDTFWHTEWGGPDPVGPHFITIDLGSLRSVGGFIYTPRQAGQNGRISRYTVDYSSDGVTWTTMASGTWPNSAALQTYDGLVGHRKARCEIAGPSGTVGGPFDVTVVFDHDVTDFTASDLQVSGGTVTSLRGKGYYYVARISPTGASVSVSVPADAVNPGGEGSLASTAAVTVAVVDTLPPVPVFTGVPAQVAGPFHVGLSFGEPVTGLTAADFTLSNATLDAIVPSGGDFLLDVTPLAEGPVSIMLAAAAVTDLAGLESEAGASAATTYLLQILARDAAEASYVGGGMVLVADPSAPGGHYLWLPEGAYPENFNPPVKPQHRAEFTFVVPHAGQWLLRGLVRAPDGTSDSFWVEIDGSAATGSVHLWDTGPVGTTYVWDYLNNRNVADPVVLNLSAGAHTVTVYGRDDGTRLARLELESLNDPPAFTADPLAGAPGAEGVLYAGSLAGFATDPDAGDVLAFAKLAGPGWLTIDPDGTLGGLPGAADTGVNLFQVRVTDPAGLADTALLSITVAAANHPPAFTTDLIDGGGATEGQPYSGTLAGTAADPNPGDALLFSKVSGPSWLEVSSGGLLSGTPGAADAGTNTFVVRVSDGAGLFDEVELRIEVTGTALPLPWDALQVGSGVPGSATHSSGTFTVTGAGRIDGRQDSFHFAWQTLSGDGEITARITAPQNTGDEARIGVMIRDTLASNSRHVFLGLNGSDGYRWVRRTSFNGNTSTSRSGSAAPPAAWVRLVRAGTTITAFKSVDGVQWVKVGSLTAAFPATCYAGLAVASGDANRLNESQFGSVVVTP
jgi:uncharacterized repeat protein (TIGR03806 family)